MDALGDAIFVALLAVGFGFFIWVGYHIGDLAGWRRGHAAGRKDGYRYGCDEVCDECDDDDCDDCCCCVPNCDCYCRDKSAAASKCHHCGDVCTDCGCSEPLIDGLCDYCAGYRDGREQGRREARLLPPCVLP